MTRQELKEKLASHNFIFINHLVKDLGGKKKGSKSQDIEEILAFYDLDSDRVISALQTKELAKLNRFTKIKNAFSEVRESWEKLVLYIESNEEVPEPIQKSIEIIDSIVDFFFPQK